VTGQRYLTTRTSAPAALPLHDERYAAIRDEFVVRFKYHTARAYAADLDHLRQWAATSRLDVIALETPDIERYVAVLAQQRYSPNTLRRKRTAIRGFYSLATRAAARSGSPMGGWPWQRRSTDLTVMS
jgi:site-specific recombinase XerD